MQNCASTNNFFACSSRLKWQFSINASAIIINYIQWRNVAVKHMIKSHIIYVLLWLYLNRFSLRLSGDVNLSISLIVLLNISKYGMKAVKSLFSFFLGVNFTPLLYFKKN